MSGPVLRTEQRKGSTNGRDWSYIQLHVLDDVDVHICRLGDDYGSIPGEGEVILAHAEVRAFARSRGGAGLGITLTKPVDPAELVADGRRAG